MADGATADVGLGHLMHLDGAHHTGVMTDLFESVRQREGVDDGREHSHVIAGDAIHTFRREGDAPEDIASADYDTDLNAFPGYSGDFIGQIANTVCIETERLRASHGFTAEFEKNPFV